MPKITPQGLSLKISLDQIVVTGNVRKEFDDIPDLASSIKQHGLLQPIVVKHYDQTPEGIPRYELVCGDRRLHAFKWLCEHGDDFSLIDAVIKTGDKHTIQLIENIQRNNLTPIETENGITEMLESGKTQTEISAALCRPISWTSDIIAASKVRAKATAAGIDTSIMSSKAISQLRSVDDDSIILAIVETIECGGTVLAATNVMKAFKHTENESQETDETIANNSPEPHSENNSSAPTNSGNIPNQNNLQHTPAPVFVSPKEVPPVKVPMNAVFDEIRAYIGNIIKQRDLLLSDLEGNAHKIEQLENFKLAALDIIELLQRRL